MIPCSNQIQSTRGLISDKNKFSYNILELLLLLLLNEVAMLSWWLRKKCYIIQMILHITCFDAVAASARYWQFSENLYFLKREKKNGNRWRISKHLIAKNCAVFAVTLLSYLYAHKHKLARLLHSFGCGFSLSAFVIAIEWLLCQQSQLTVVNHKSNKSSWK